MAEIKPEYKLKARHFIPIVGMYSYSPESKKNMSEGDSEVFVNRLGFLALYNAVIGLSTIAAMWASSELEKLVQ